MRVWWTLVLYGINELGPLALFLIPVYWTQQTIVQEESRSMRAQSQVQSVQRQQEELLDALLPSAIVEHIRAGGDPLAIQLGEASAEAGIKVLNEAGGRIEEPIVRGIQFATIQLAQNLNHHGAAFTGSILANTAAGL